LVAEQRTCHALVEGGRLSFLHYLYPLVAPVVSVGGLRVAAVADIGCMKVVAIAQRAEKKDFFDLMAVLQQISVPELKALLVAKYGPRRLNLYHVVKSLLYFAEAEESPSPVSLTGTTWEEVKAFFRDREQELWRELVLND